MYLIAAKAVTGTQKIEAPERLKQETGSAGKTAEPVWLKDMPHRQTAEKKRKKNSSFLNRAFPLFL